MHKPGKLLGTAMSTAVTSTMALLRYLQPRDGLPDPRGTLCSCLPSQAIAEANREVQKATSSTKRKRGPYKRYSAPLFEPILASTPVPNTLQLILPCRFRKRALIREIFRGKWPTMTFSRTTATAYGSLALFFSLSHLSSSPTAAFHSSL